MMLFTQKIDSFGNTLDAYRGCFSKPQWKHFTTYMNGLVLGEKGEKNIQDIACNALDGKHQSSLNRFLTIHRWNKKRLNAFRLKESLHDRDGGVLIVDDTLIEKTGKHMGCVGYLYDHSKGKDILCHDVVSTFYHNREQRVPLYFTPYIKKEIAEKQNVWFKTKIQIALDILRMSFVQVNPEAIVFDEWYMCKEVIDFLNNRGHTWVSQAKSNRLIQRGGKWRPLKRYAKNLQKNTFRKIYKIIDEERFKWFHETTVVMKKVGLVKLVILRRRKNSKTCTFLVSNNIDLDGMQILEYYKNRWSIEVFHRDCKQHLGMGEYQVRKLDAVVIHLHLVFLAYTLLKNAWRDPFLNHLLDGIKAIGSICKRLKRWVFDRFSKKSKKHSAIQSI
jgi:hypothetical protein